MENPSLPLDPRSEELFREIFARLDAAEPADFEAMFHSNPAIGRKLNELRQVVEIANRLCPTAGDSRSLAARLEEQFGTLTGRTTSLEDEPRPQPGASDSLFEKLRGVGIRGTRYKLLGELARGGMGVILKIWDDELRRTLAMKVVLGRGDESQGETPVVDSKTLGRFLEEAQVTGQLDHPGIVPVHELGLGADGRVYFTMRLVKGEDLRSIFEKVRTGEDGWNQVRALGVLLKVCEAMSYAHSKEVVHRDLKPGNVMVGKFGEVYVMDWGLARVIGREDRHDLRIQPQPTTQSVVKTERRERRDETPDSPLITMDGDIVGTPSFMPPEQAMGQLERLGPHSDVYSLGAMLYQLLTGEIPFVPAGARVSQHTILESVMRRAPEPIRSLAPSTPPELVAICEKAMAREISERYPTMQSFADDLRAYLEHRVVGAYESGVVAELRKWIARNKAGAFAIAATTALVIAVPLARISYTKLRLERMRSEERDALASSLGMDSPEEFKKIAPLVARLSRRILEGRASSEEAFMFASNHIVASLELEPVQGGGSLKLACNFKSRFEAADPGLVLFVKLSLYLDGQPFGASDIDVDRKFKTTNYDLNHKEVAVTGGQDGNGWCGLDLNEPVSRLGPHEITGTLTVRFVRATDIPKEVRADDRILGGFYPPFENMGRCTMLVPSEVIEPLLGEIALQTTILKLGPERVTVLDEVPQGLPAAVSTGSLLDAFAGATTARAELNTEQNGDQTLLVTVHLPKVELLTPFQLGLAVDGQLIEAEFDFRLGKDGIQYHRFQQYVLLGRDRITTKSHPGSGSSSSWNLKQATSEGVTLTLILPRAQATLDLEHIQRTPGSLTLLIDTEPTQARDVFARGELVYLDVAVQADLVLGSTVGVTSRRTK